MKLTEQSEALTGRVWRLAHRMLRREGVTEDHAMAVADVIRFEVEKELPAIEAAVRAESGAEKAALVEKAYADGRHDGAMAARSAVRAEALPTVEALAEAIASAVYESDPNDDDRDMARAILVALAATPAPAPERCAVCGHEQHDAALGCTFESSEGTDWFCACTATPAPAPEADR